MIAYVYPVPGRLYGRRGVGRREARQSIASKRVSAYRVDLGLTSCIIQCAGTSPMHEARQADAYLENNKLGSRSRN